VEHSFDFYNKIGFSKKWELIVHDNWEGKIAKNYSQELDEVLGGHGFLGLECL